MRNANNIVIVGAMANNSLYFNGLKVGKSLIEENSKKIIEKIYSEAKEYNCNILIPEIVMFQLITGFGCQKNDSINENEIILDIGPKTIKNIEKIIDQSNTVLWNGPAGYFENQNFLSGTLAIATKILKIQPKKSHINTRRRRYYFCDK